MTTIHFAETWHKNRPKYHIPKLPLDNATKLSIRLHSYRLHYKAVDSNTKLSICQKCCQMLQIWRCSQLTLPIASQPSADGTRLLIDTYNIYVLKWYNSCISVSNIIIMITEIINRVHMISMMSKHYKRDMVCPYMDFYIFHSLMALSQHTHNNPLLDLV